MARSQSSSSGSSNSPHNPHRYQARLSPATEHLRQFVPWDSRSPSQDNRSQNQNQNQNQRSTSAGSAARAAASLAVLLGIAQPVESRSASRRSDNPEYSMPTSPNSTNGGRGHHVETSPLLDDNGGNQQPPSPARPGGVYGKEDTKARRIVWTGLTLLFVAALVFFVGFVHLLSDKVAPWVGLLPKDPQKAALVIMKQAPVIVRFLMPISSNSRLYP